MTAVEALGCQACGLPITPCLICASPLPVPGVDDPLFKTCRSCGVVNPLGKFSFHLLAASPLSGNLYGDPCFCEAFKREH